MTGKNRLWPLSRLRVAALLLDRDGGIVEATPEATALLAGGSLPKGLNGPQLIRLPGGSEVLMEEWPGDAGEATRLVTITPFRVDASGRVRVLREAFGLTEGEANALAALLRHGSREAAIRAEKINRNTLKSQLASIGAKIGISKTCEWQAIFSRLAALGSKPRA